MGVVCTGTLAPRTLEPRDHNFGTHLRFAKTKQICVGIEWNTKPVRMYATVGMSLLVEDAAKACGKNSQNKKRFLCSVQCKEHQDKKVDMWKHTYNYASAGLIQRLVPFLF